jgi:hypothetical protein
VENLKVEMALIKSNGARDAATTSTTADQNELIERIVSVAIEKALPAAVEKLLPRITVLEARVNGVEQAGTPVKAADIAGDVVRRMNVDEQERLQREDKKDRLVLFNFPESELEAVEEKENDDLSRVREFAELIGIPRDSVTGVHRDRKMKNKEMRILKITFDTSVPDERMKFMRGFKKARDDNGWDAAMWTRPDYTMQQQMELMRLNDSARYFSQQLGLNIFVRDFGLWERTAANFVRRFYAPPRMAQPLLGQAGAAAAAGFGAMPHQDGVAPGNGS